FRVDLRLRPDPAATQVAVPMDAAAVYYESVGQNWERAAMIKARPVAGDLETGRDFVDSLSPFVWRKYLDFAAIADIRAMKRQIHAHKGFGSITVPGHNVKLGRGGIREIEFFAQTQQLIAGGRQPELRTPETLEALSRLAHRDWIDAPAATELTDDYKALRVLEHRIQMIADEQTQQLPSDDDGLDRIAAFSGFETREAFADDLTARLTRVHG
ncbi:MAG: bifunctional [glutamine synthetase] adenylyltransferase/[glutamine synthetase]-adenylyl-L-tyrosine phosphorylase, partial [Pseudomonadota bacterium]